MAFDPQPINEILKAAEADLAEFHRVTSAFFERRAAESLGEKAAFERRPPISLRLLCGGDPPQRLLVRPHWQHHKRQLDTSRSTMEYLRDEPVPYHQPAPRMGVRVELASDGNPRCSGYSYEHGIESAQRLVEVVREFLHEPLKTFARSSWHCCFCGRGLTDEVSRSRGIGPECFSAVNVIRCFIRKEPPPPLELRPPRKPTRKEREFIASLRTVRTMDDLQLEDGGEVTDCGSVDASGRFVFTSKKVMKASIFSATTKTLPIATIWKSSAMSGECLKPHVVRLFSVSYGPYSHSQPDGLHVAFKEPGRQSLRDYRERFPDLMIIALGAHDIQPAGLRRRNPRWDPRTSWHSPQEMREHWEEIAHRIRSADIPLILDTVDAALDHYEAQQRERVEHGVVAR